MRHWHSGDILCCCVSVVLTTAHSGCASRNERGVTGIERRILDELASDGVAPLNPTQERGTPDEFDLPATGPITLGDLLAAAEVRNPALAAARSEIGVAAGRAWQAARYPNPRVEISAEEVPFDSGIDQGITVASITQPIVLSDRLKAGETAAQAEQAASRARAELRRREIFGDIAQLHARLIANRRADAAYAQLAQLGAQTLQIAQTRFDAKAAPETEVIRPRIEQYQIEIARDRLAKERSADTQHLSLLLGGIKVDVDRLDEGPADLPPRLELEDLQKITRQSHPSLAVADREIDAAEARLAQMKSRRVPDLDVRFGAGYKGETEDGIFELGAGATLPLWDNSDGDVLAARFDLMRARQHRLAIESEVLAQLAQAHGEYESARTQLEAVRDRIVPAATRSYELTQDAYRGGNATFLELLDAQRTLTEASITLHQLSGNAGTAQARIMQITGWRVQPPTAGSVGSTNSHTQTTSNGSRFQEK